MRDYSRSLENSTNTERSDKKVQLLLGAVRALIESGKQREAQRRECERNDENLLRSLDFGDEESRGDGDEGGTKGEGD